MDSQIHKIHQLLVDKEITCTALVQEKLDLLKSNTNNTVNSLLDTLCSSNNNYYTFVYLFFYQLTLNQNA